MSNPLPLFVARADIHPSAMSVLELMSELDRRGWVCKPKAELDVRPRDVLPYTISTGSPKVWYSISGKLAFKEYLLALLIGEEMKLSKVHHFQCKSYYQCLKDSDSPVLPHQTAQYYKALMRRKEKGRSSRPHDDDNDSDANLGNEGAGAKSTSFNDTGDADALDLHAITDPDHAPGAPSAQGLKFRGRGRGRGRGRHQGRLSNPEDDIVDNSLDEGDDDNVDDGDSEEGFVTDVDDDNSSVAEIVDRADSSSDPHRATVAEPAAGVAEHGLIELTDSEIGSPPRKKRLQMQLAEQAGPAAAELTHHDGGMNDNNSNDLNDLNRIPAVQCVEIETASESGLGSGDDKNKGPDSSDPGGPGLGSGGVGLPGPSGEGDVVTVTDAVNLGVSASGSASASAFCSDTDPVPHMPVGVAAPQPAVPAAADGDGDGDSDGDDSLPPQGSDAVFTPMVNSTGHKKICEILLPMLLSVMQETSWKNKSARDQMREALDRSLANDWVVHCGSILSLLLTLLNSQLSSSQFPHSQYSPSLSLISQFSGLNFNVILIDFHIHCHSLLVFSNS